MHRVIEALKHLLVFGLTLLRSKAQRIDALHANLGGFRAGLEPYFTIS